MLISLLSAIRIQDAALFEPFNSESYQLNSPQNGNVTFELDERFSAENVLDVSMNRIRNNEKRYL